MRALVVAGMALAALGIGADAGGAAQARGAAAAAQAGGAEHKPVTISADRLEVDRKIYVAKYSGNVVATDRGRCMTIIANEMEFNFDEKMEEIQKAVAQGQVQIFYRDKKSVSDQAEYYPKEDRAVLTGRPKVWQENDLLVGSKITILFKEDRSIVESDGKQRVQAVFNAGGRDQRTKRPAPTTRGECD